jgi:hypothetical protein
MFHRVELLVDSHAWGDGEHLGRMQELQQRIIALCIENLKLEDGHHRLRINRMKGLRNAWRMFEACHQDKHSKPPVREMSQVASGKIALPHNLSVELKGINATRCIIVSDTKERMLRVFFPGAGDGFSYVRIGHKDSIGALQRITSEVAKGFDIVNSLTRLHADRRNHLDLLLYASDLPRVDQEPQRRLLLDYLLSSDALSTLQITRSYPRSAGSASGGDAPSRCECPIELPPFEPLLDSTLAGLKPNDITNKRIAEYEKLVKRETGYEKVDGLKKRLAILRSLRDFESTPRPRLQVFVSGVLKRTELFDVVEKILKRKNCEMVTGKHTESEIREAVVKRIEQADAFLGIWTDGQAFSPWLLWELGVAQAHRRPMQLLIDGTVPEDLWKRVVPEREHYHFNSVDFEAVCGRVIALLIEEAARKRDAHRRHEDGEWHSVHS